MAIFAVNGAHLGKDTVVTGDVVTGDDGAEVALDKNVLVTGDVASHTIDMSKDSTIDGNATYVELEAARGATITGTQTIAPPPYADAPVFRQASPGGEDVFVGAGETVILDDEGFYGRIQMAQGATLLFSRGGVFDVASIDAAKDCRILFDAPTDLRVEGQIEADKDVFVGAVDGSGVGASDILIYVGGADGGGPPAAVDFDKNAVVEGTIYAPNGTIRFDKDATITGALLGLVVEIGMSSTVTGDSAFANQVPTAFAQEVLTDGANDLVITLEGSDPEGGDLSFSIEVDPAEGTLGTISPIFPAPVDQCSQSGETCTVDSDCPGVAEGETCETVQPPVSQATVTYSPTAAGCETVFSCSATPETACTVGGGECPAGETCVEGDTTCPEDFFTFGVTDDCGDLGTAIVSVNGGTDEVPDDPGAGVDTVEANDLEVDTVVNQVRVLTLSAAAPGTVASLTFRVETLPTGALKDSNGAPVVAGVDLPSPVVTYQAPASTGSDNFTFSARDSATGTPPCGPPSCDTGTVNIDVGSRPELAPDQSVETDLNTPVKVTLRANSGGTAGGSLAAGSLSAVEVTYDDNGPPLSEAQRSRLAGIKAGPTALDVDQGWFQFGWCDIATSPGCNDLVDLVNESEVIESPFDFTTTAVSCLRVTDTLAKGDHWRVENLAGGNVDWTDFTSEVDQSSVSTTSDPDVAFGDLSYSHGEFDLDAGTFSVRLTTIPPDSFAFGTAAYIRVDTGPCVDIVWTITSLPAADTGTLTNLDGSAVQIGDTYFAEPTVMFTPAFNFSGSTSFVYEVSQGGTVGTAVVDTAIVELLVSATDPCILVGRQPGCAPGGGGLLQGETESIRYVSELDAADGPSDGLTLIVEGEGTVASSPVPLKDNRVLRGLVCTNECTKQFPVGSFVGVNARPEPGSEFVGWSGACRGDYPIGAVRLGKQTICKATFVKEEAAE